MLQQVQLTTRNTLYMIPERRELAIPMRAGQHTAAGPLGKQATRDPLIKLLPLTDQVAGALHWSPIASTNTGSGHASRVSKITGGTAGSALADCLTALPLGVLGFWDVNC